MPRHPGSRPEDHFLRANLNDPDNQAALLRAYLDLKQTTEGLSAKLARATEELSQREASQVEVTRQAKEAGQQELAAKEVRLDRMGQAMRLIRWAAEWAAKDGSFLVGCRHDLGQVITVAASSAESCEQIRYDKATDTWVVAWGDGRPPTVIAISPPKAAGPPRTPGRRRQAFTGH